MIPDDDCENFFLKMLSLNETILPNDILKKEKEFNQVVFSLNLVFDNECDDVFFLSGLLFTLTKFTYTRNVLISRLFKCHDGKVLKFFEKIPFGIKINTNANVEDFLSEVKSLTLKIYEYRSHFSFFKRKNNLIFPDFQYICKNDFSDIGIPESNFSVIFENSKKSRIKIKYNSSLYSDDFVELFYNSFVMILNKFYNEKKALLKNISINPNIKKKLPVFKALPMRSIGELFEKVVEENEDKLALIANDANLSYGELNREANCVANSLIKKGLKIEDRVIIDLNRDSKLIISILGVIKAGGILILINSLLPKDRVSFIKLNTSPKYTITNDKFKEDSNPEDDDSVVNIDLLLNNECDENNPSVNLKKGNVFSIVYTSGITGIPKGVMLTHESMIKEIDDVHRFYNDDNFKTLIGLSVLFSGFIQSLLVELLGGVTVVLADDDVYRDPLKLYKTFKETDFNLLALTPSAIEMYLEFDILKDMIKRLKIIVLGGEKVGSNLVRKIHEINSDIKLFVGYGLTETSTANIKLLKPDGNINVGKPILNVVEVLVDIDGNPLPSGVLGELWIGGLCISKGYWRDEELTKENFLLIDDITYFKSGDLAKYDENGEYTLFSRIDDQLNIHGYRIEIGEIESNIPQNIGLKKSIATVKEINNEPVICLYFTTAIKLSKTKIDKLKNMIDEELKDKLPFFMVPRFYIQIDDFIFTQTGKVNTKDLPEPQPSDLISNQKILSPETEIEKDLFKISSELLGHDNFGINNNFSSIGFSSLLLTKLLSYIFENYDVEINSRSLLLEDTNIQNISEQIKKSSTIGYTNHERKKHYLLTPQQYYFYKSKNYPHVPFHIKFNKDFDVYDLKSALIGTIDLNPYIKTTFEKIGSVIYQKVNPYLVFNIPIYEKELTNEIKKGFIKDFDLFEGSLFRFELYYYHDEVSLLMDIHHILIDNYGVEIFLNDLLDIYDNKKINSKKFDYYDYSTEISSKKKWRDVKIKESKYFEKQLRKFSHKCDNRGSKYFEKQLRKFSYKYFNDHYLNKENSDNINKMDYNKSPSVVGGDFHRIMLYFKGNFKKLSKKYNVSINQMILSAVVFSLGKMFDIDCLLINMTVDGRNNPKYYNTVGYFSYILPIFLDVNHETPLDYFDEVKKQTDISIGIYSPYFYPEKIDPLIIYNPTNLYKSNRFIKEGLESSLEELFPYMFFNSNVHGLYFLVALSDDEISLFLYFNMNCYSDDEIEELFKGIDDFIGGIADGDEEIISELYFSGV